MNCLLIYYKTYKNNMIIVISYENRSPNKTTKPRIILDQVAKLPKLSLTNVLLCGE